MTPEVVLLSVHRATSKEKRKLTVLTCDHTKTNKQEQQAHILQTNGHVKYYTVRMI